MQILSNPTHVCSSFLLLKNKSWLQFLTEKVINIFEFFNIKVKTTTAVNKFPSRRQRASAVAFIGTLITDEIILTSLFEKEEDSSSGRTMLINAFYTQLFNK